VPAQLKRLFSHIDRAWLLVLLLSLLAAWPFLMRSSLPRETDAELHVFRAAELGYALRAGVLYPRWAPDFYYGYGYPIFNYYAPLTYYLANLFSLAIPGGAVFGVKAVFVAGFIGAGVGAYGMGRHLHDSRTGLITAVSYLFAPYVYLIDPHLRGDLAEFFALGVAPLAFWALAAFHQERSRRNLVLATGLIAALILSHNLLALIYFALLLAYTLWQSLLTPLIKRQPIEPASLGLSLLPLFIGLALAAFFWLPVGLEGNAVRLSNLIGPGHFDYRNHFLSLEEIFSPSIPLDLGAANPAFRFNLGVGQWLLALIGLVTLIISVIRHTGISTQITAYLFWVLSFFFLVILMLPLSQPLWDAVPLMAFLQFPWRLLGPAAFCLAIVAGQASHLLDLAPLTARPFTLAMLIVFPLILTLPIFVPPSWGDFGPTDQLAMLEFELNGRALGTTSTGDFIPVSVITVPEASASLIDSYRRGGPIDKVDRETLPSNTSVEIIRHQPTADVFATSSPEDFTLRVLTFMFAGWQASIDGMPVPIQPSEPEGFITIAVPAGEHTVRVWLGTTPARTLATLISLSGLAALGLIARWLPRHSAAERPAESVAKGYWPSFVGLAVFVVVAIAGNKLGLFQPRSSGLIAIPAEYRVHSYLQGGIDLIGFDLPVTALEPGQSLPLTLYWKAREPVPGNYQVFVHLTTIPEHTWGQSDKLNPGDYPTSRWPLDRYVRDLHSFTIPLGTPPGEYTLRVGLWNFTTGVRQLVLAADGQILGDSISLPVPITVLPASRQPSPDELSLDVRLNQPVTDSLTLIGVDIHPDGVFRDEMGLLTLALYWRAETAPLADYTIALRLTDSEGHVIMRSDAQPADGNYPTVRWANGQVVRDVHSFWVNTDLPAGNYAVELGLLLTGHPETEPVTWIRIAEIQRILPE
jgi:hypothetical protein